jgi:PAS domain S-box-containing protein
VGHARSVSLRRRRGGLDLIVPPRRHKAYSAAAHLTLFAFIVAAPLLMLLGLSLYGWAELEREQLEQRIVQVARDLADSVDRDIDRDMTVLRTLVTSPALEGEVWSVFYDQVKASLGNNAFFVLVDLSGRQLINTYAPYGKAPALTGDPETFRRVRETGRPSVSKLFTSVVAQRPVYNVSIPVMRDGKLRYVANMSQFPERLSGLLKGQSLQAPWQTRIWDGGGIVLADLHDNAGLVGKPVPSQFRSQQPFTIFRTIGMDGTEVLAAVGRSALSDWNVAVAFPVDLANARRTTSLWVWALVIVATAALVALLASLFGREMTRPLAAATRAAEALGHGQEVIAPRSRLVEANAVNEALVRAKYDLDVGLAALRHREEQLSSAADAAQFGAHEYDVASDRSVRSPQFLRILGVGPDDAAASFGYAMGFVHPDDRSRVLAEKQEVIAGGESHYQLEYRIRRPDGEVRWVMDRGRVVRAGASGQAERVVGVLIDITTLKLAEQRQSLLFDELNHRVKNTLAIVQALAQQTMRSQPDPASFIRIFEGRVASLARANDLLTRGAWRGAGLREIVDTALAPFADGRRPIEIAGNPAEMPANITVTLSLMLHELATNAAKYGALSVPDGRLSIRWTAETTDAGTAIDLEWLEQGGPAVTAPERKGFGSRLLTSGAQQINAKIELEYPPTGARCRLLFVVPSPSPSSLSSSSSSS